LSASILYSVYAIDKFVEVTSFVAEITSAKVVSAHYNHKLLSYHDYRSLPYDYNTIDIIAYR